MCLSSPFWCAWIHARRLARTLTDSCGSFSFPLLTIFFKVDLHYAIGASLFRDRDVLGAAAPM